MIHPDRDELEGFVMGDGGERMTAIETHLAQCDACMTVVSQEARFEGLLHDAGRMERCCPGCGGELPATRCDGCGAVRRAGAFEIREVLVQNGHGRLYRAVGPDGSVVALKELAFIRTPTLDQLRAFEREASYLQTLEHPNIPRFVASFSEGAGIHLRLYIAQQYIEGESLESVLVSHRFREDEAREVARRVIQILIYLQRLTPMVFHRDLKPANILRRPDGSLVLVDFGAAYTVGETVGSTVIGTFGYMPVEQLGGIVDATTDLYALGATLLHLVTRLEPWKVIDNEPLGSANLSPGFRSFVEKLIARDPGDRFRSAEEALVALNRPYQPAPPPRTGRRTWSRPATVLAAGLGLSTFALGAAMFKMRSSAAPVVAVVAPAAPVVAPAGSARAPAAATVPPRPDWVLPEIRALPTPEVAPATSHCEPLDGGGLSCTGASLYVRTRDEGREQALDGAIEAVLDHTVDDLFARGVLHDTAGAHDLVIGDHGLLGSPYTRFRLNGQVFPTFEALTAASKGDKTIAKKVEAEQPRTWAAIRALLTLQHPPGLPTAPASWFWEEYDATNGVGTEFLVFVRVTLTGTELRELASFYTNVQRAGGAELSPVIPLVGWLFKSGAIFGGKTGFVVRTVGPGRLRDLGVKVDDVVLVDPGSTLTDAVGAAKVEVRRGDTYQIVLELPARAR